MLNAAETAAAEAALVYPARDMPRDERVAAIDAYNAEARAITAQFAAYLAHTYLSDFNTQVQEAVYERATDVGGGYANIELAYEELAELVNLV